MLADAAEPLGRGWGFGIHEALDQVGAVAGPLLLAAVLAVRDADYRLAFTILAVPGVLAMLALVVARRVILDHHDTTAGESLDVDSPIRSDDRAKVYLGFVFLSALGFAPFPLIAFHVSAQEVAADARVPLMFALAMAVDAATALVAGRFYDRRGLRVLVALPILSSVAVLAFSTAVWVVWLGIAAWGAVMGIQESTLRALVGDLSTSARRATAYGVFYTAYGVALLVGGVLLGLLYDWSIPAMVALVIVAQVVAAFVLGVLLRRQQGRVRSLDG